MIIVDTGPFIALFDKSDHYHDICHNILSSIKPPMLTTLPVLTEAFYMLNFSWHIQDRLWNFIIQENIKIVSLSNKQLSRCRELMKKYHDLPMDFADASLIAAAEAENISTVFTLDHKDFKVYRGRQKKQFKLLPAKL